MKGSNLEVNFVDARNISSVEGTPIQGYFILSCENTEHKT